MKNTDLSRNFDNNLKTHIELFKSLSRHKNHLFQLVEQCHEAIKNGGKIIFCGNGGSAADSQHLAAEFVVRFKKNRRALPAIALTTDSSILTANSNDFDFNTVFSRQIEALCNENDILIGLTTSGRSENVNLALKSAKSIGAYTVALTGVGGGTVKSIADLSIIVHHTETARIQEAHMFMGHWLCEAFDHLY